MAQPREILSSNSTEIYRMVQDHALTATGIGEWSGTIDGIPVLLRMETPRRVRAHRMSRGRAPEPETGAFVTQVVEAAHRSRWF
jgi:hypothetical protein